MICPCKECKKRTPNCHGTCDIYSKWAKEREKLRKKERKNKYLEYITR